MRRALSFTSHRPGNRRPSALSPERLLSCLSTSLRYAVGNVLVVDTRPTTAEERLFRFGVVRRALRRNEFRCSVRQPNPGVWPPSVIFVTDKTARHIAGLQRNQPIDLSEKSYSVREGCRVNKC